MNHIHPVSPEFRIVADAPVPQPAPQALSQAKKIWEGLAKKRPGLCNTRIFSLERVRDNAAHGFMAEYMWHVAQHEDPALFSRFGARPLAVSGLVEARGHVFFGLRRARLAIEGGLWEPVPWGLIEDPVMLPDAELDWRNAFAEHLRAQLGAAGATAQPQPFALIEHDAANAWTSGWTLGVAARLDADHRDILGSWASLEATGHSELAAVPVSDVPRFFKQRGASMTGAAGPLLTAYGLLEARA